MACMRAYFDESGTHDEARVTAIAGYVGSKDVWTVVETAWRGALALYADKGVKTFHMKDCVAGKGEFQRLDTFFRMALITQLSNILKENDIQAIWSAVIVEDWHAVVDDPIFLARFPK